MHRVLAVHVRSICALIAITVLCGSISTAFAYPKPNRVPTRWQLNFEVGNLRLFVDRADGNRYWYFTYKVTNHTGKDRYWAPRLTLFTDTGDIMNSGENVPLQIERRLIAFLGNDLIEPQNQVIGKILVGDENAIEGLVAWPAADMNITEMSLFISGISGETAEVKLPISGKSVILQKTQKIDYVVPGDPLTLGDQPVIITKQEWVMR